MMYATEMNIVQILTGNAKWLSSSKDTKLTCLREELACIHWEPELGNPHQGLVYAQG